MQYLIAFIVLVVFSMTTFGSEGPIEYLNRKADQFITGSDCSNPNHEVDKSKDCKLRSESRNAGAIEKMSENIFYNQLSEAEIDRLKCAIEKTNSLESQSPVSNLALNRLNETLPYLDQINKEINELRNANQLLKGEIGNMDENYSSIKFSEDKKKKILLYNMRNEILKKKILEFERRMAEIPNADLPEVKSLIESRLSGKYQGIKLFTATDFKEFNKVATDKMKESLEDIVSSKRKIRSQSYELDRDTKIRLAQDPELIATLMKNNPESLDGIYKFQCLASQRQRGGDALVMGSLLLPFGSLGLAKVARMRSILAVPFAAKTLANGSRFLGLSAAALGVKNGYDEITKSCLSGPGTTNNKCEVTLKSITEEYSKFDCISGLLLNSANAAGGILGLVKGQQSKVVADFVERSKKGLRSQDLETAKILDKDQRTDAAQALLKRNLNSDEKKAIDEAHKIGDGFGRYTQADIDKKREILHAGGFSHKETEIILWKGIAGKGSSSNTAASYFDGMKADQAQSILRTQVRMGHDWDRRYSQLTPEMDNLLKRGLEKNPGYQKLAQERMLLEKQKADLNQKIRYREATEQEKQAAAALDEKIKTIDGKQDEIVGQLKGQPDYKELEQERSDLFKTMMANDDPDVRTAKIVAAKEQNNPKLIEEALRGRMNATIADADAQKTAKEASELAKITAQDMQELLDLKAIKITGKKEDGKLIYLLEKGNGKSIDIVETRVDAIINESANLKRVNLDELIEIPPSTASANSGLAHLHEIAASKARFQVLVALEDKIQGGKLANTEAGKKLLVDIDSRIESERKLVQTIIEKLRKSEGQKAVEEIERYARNRK